MEYPLLTASQSADKRSGSAWPSRREVFLDVVAQVEALQTEATISNPAHDKLKKALNRAFEDAWRKLADVHIYGQWTNLPDDVRAYWNHFGLAPELHRIASFVKKAERPLDHPLRAKVIALLAEMAPLADQFATLKEKITKRTPKPVAEHKEGYHPPPASTEAERQVIALLEGITQQSYVGLMVRLIANQQVPLAEYLAAVASDPKLTPHQHFVKGKKYPNHEAAYAVNRLIDQHNRALPDANEIIGREAIKTADQYRTHFVHKNFRKIASVIDAKGDYLSGEAVEGTVHLTGMSGMLRFHFVDGAHFTVVNKVVGVVNQNGTRFLRYPLTFHHVVMASGERMKHPSEKRMNEVFAARQKEAA